MRKINPKLSFEEAEEMDEAWGKVKMRKERERRRKNGTIYTILAVILFIWGFFSSYPTNQYIFLSAMVITICAMYWIIRSFKN